MWSALTRGCFSFSARFWLVELCVCEVISCSYVTVVTLVSQCVTVSHYVTLCHSGHTCNLISLSHGSSFQPKFLFSLDNFKHLLTENRIPSKLKASLLPLNLSQLQQCARLDGQLGTRKSLFQSRRSSDRLRTLNVLSTTYPLWVNMGENSIYSSQS